LLKTRTRPLAILPGGSCGEGLKNPTTASGVTLASVVGPRSYRHIFSSLTIGHVGIKNLEMLVIPDYGDATMT
jgi:hypothetical protein